MLPYRKKIKGSGGGGKGGDQHFATEYPDSLQSQAFAQVIDVISEGEIQGLVKGMQSVFFDGTPLQNADGSFNFTNVVVQARAGLQDQDHLVGFEDVSNEIAVSVEVTHAAPQTFRITDSTMDAVNVRLQFPTLTWQNPSTGDLVGNTVEIKIELQANGGGYQTIIDDTIKGKSTSKYERQYRIELLGSAPWDIRVSKVTPDATTSNDQKRVILDSYTEISDVKLKYPNSAVVGVRIDSSQFQNIPTRGYEILGLRIKLPTNYDPASRTYTGPWDGTFRIDYSNNPAWIFYDLLTSSRYGLGQFIPEDHVDKWGLYQIGRYCDELVDDGFGGQEPRFTCNLYLQTRADALKVIQDLASAFRGMIYWAGGVIMVAQDGPQDAKYLFTQANVVEGRFTYAGVSAKSRHTVALVTWNDPADFYKQKVEYVEDQQMVAQYGIIETSVVAFGCTSRGQAHRVGQWLLFTEKYQTETITFQTGIEGAPVRPGDVIKVADPMRAGVRRGGRLMSGCTTTSLNLDSAPGISADGSFLSVMLPDQTVERIAIESVVGQTVTLQSALSQAPNAGSIWVAETTDVEPQQFRVVALTEPKPGIFEVTALEHNPEKFDYIEKGIQLSEIPISELQAVPDSPTNVEVTETLYSVGRDVRVKVTCSWHQVKGAVGYNVQWVRDAQNPVNIPQTAANEIEILQAEPGTYNFQVTAVNTAGVKSVPAKVTKVILGRGAAPSDVTNFSMLPVGGQAYLSWDPSPDLDVTIGGYVRIRHTPIDDGTAQWKNGVDIVPALDGTATRAYAPLLSGTYMAKFFDSSDNSSTNEAVIITTIPQAIALNVAASFSENPAWSGTFSNMQYLSDYNGISIASAVLFDSLTDLDAQIAFDFPGGVADHGEYQFANSPDLGGVFTSNITAAITVDAIDIADTWDERLNMVDDWRDIDGAFIDDVNAELWLRTTEDNPAGSPTWTEWKRFFTGAYRFRAAQFKVMATSDNSQHNVNISALSITIDMEDRVVHQTAQTSGATSYTVTFPEPFYATPTIGITADGMNSGDYFRLTGKSNTGFTITFYNSSNVAVSRVFDYMAKGYGRKVA